MQSFLMQPEVHVFGRAIADHLNLPPNTPLLLALGLREHTPELIPLLLKELERYRIWDEANLRTQQDRIVV